MCVTCFTSKSVFHLVLDFHFRGVVRNASYTQNGCCFKSSVKKKKKTQKIVAQGKMPRFLFVPQRELREREMTHGPIRVFCIERFWELLLQIQGEGCERSCCSPLIQKPFMTATQGCLEALFGCLWGRPWPHWCWLWGLSTFLLKGTLHINFLAYVLETRIFEYFHESDDS